MELLANMALPMGIMGTLWFVLVWVAFGFVAALIAKAIMPGKDPGGFLVTVLIGIVGAILGGFIGKFIFGWSFDGNVSFWSFKSWVTAIGGALLILFAWKQINKNK